MTPEELRNARIHLGLSQAGLAAALGVAGGSRTVGRWERGERAVPGVVGVAMALMLERQPEPAEPPRRGPRKRDGS